MPNHCENRLKVKTARKTKAAQKQLEQFTNDHIKIIGRNNLETAKIQAERKKKEFAIYIEPYDDNQFNFEGSVPMPKSIFKGSVGEEERKKYGADNWYDWSIMNWGTKWNAYNTCDINIEKNEFSCEFSTAWGPPIEWLRKASEKYPLLKMEIKYEEPNMDMKGTLTAQNGNLKEK